MFTILLQVAIVCAISYALWKQLRQSSFKLALNNLRGPPSQSFFFGVYPQFLSPNGWEFHKEMVQKYGGIVKIKAILGENQIFVSDPKALQHIIVKDQDKYDKPTSFIEAVLLLFGPGISGTLGDQHRKQRKLLNPAFFSITHLREIVPVFYDVCYKLRDTFASMTKDGPQEIDIVPWMTRTTLELIGQSGFGYSFEPLTQDGVSHPYSAAVRSFRPTVHKLRISATYLLPMCMKIGTPKFRRFILDILPWKTLHKLRDMVDVLHNTSVEIFEAKKKALDKGDEAFTQQIAKGKDIMSILMRANVSASEENRMSQDELLAQMSTFIFAGMDTTSSLLVRILYHLSTHQDVQSKLRQEIVEARNSHGDLEYDELGDLPYLDAVCRETMRLDPPVPTVSRTAKQDVVLPLSTPVKGLDGREITEVPIPSNTYISIGILACNRNPEIWGPDSCEWKPERWLTPLPESVSAAHIPVIYSNLMTFAGGARSCLGFKVSILEFKVVLSLLIESFELIPSKKEISWQMSSPVTPIVVGEGTQAQLPMIVKPIV